MPDAADADQQAYTMPDDDAEPVAAEADPA
jgi:hypothetical protein